MPANERQVGGSHYKQNGEEHWDRVVSHGLDYFQAQITKYVERCWEKNGVQDLEKAAHFIEKYIEVSRAQGRQGKLQEAIGLELSRLDFMCRFFETEDGTFTFPDGLTVECKKKPKAEAVDHRSDSVYNFEGIKEGIATYTCRRCNTTFQVRVDQRPESAHRYSVSDGRCYACR